MGLFDLRRFEWFAIQEGLRYHLRNLRKKEQEMLEAERQAEQQRLQQMKSEMLETELQNKTMSLLSKQQLW